MILYHFTSNYNLHNVGEDNIRAVGLRAYARGMQSYNETWNLKIPPAVWFTAEEWPDPEQSMAAHMEIRLTADIPETDPRLFRWHDYLHRHLSREQFMEMRKRLRAKKLYHRGQQFWVYFGNVPRQYLRLDFDKGDIKTQQRYLDVYAKTTKVAN